MMQVEAAQPDSISIEFHVEQFQDAAKRLGRGMTKDEIYQIVQYEFMRTKDLTLPDNRNDPTLSWEEASDGHSFKVTYTRFDPERLRA